MSSSSYYNNGNLKDYYFILQIDRNAEVEVISFAYKALAKKNHPDMGGTAEKMKLLNEAYDVLKDPESKKEYDRLYDAQKLTKQIEREERSTVNNKDYNAQKSQEGQSQYSTQTKTNTYEKTGFESNDTYPGTNQYGTNDLIERVKDENLSNRVYEVVVRNFNFIIPNLCICCLEKPECEMKASYSFNERNALFYRYKSVIVTFPICRNCKAHIREYLIKRTLFLILSVLPSAIIVLYLAYKMPDINLGILMAIGLIGTGLSTFLANKAIKMSELTDHHASRGTSATIMNCDEWGIKIWFSNWLYAQQFAKDNGSQVASISGKRHGRDNTFINKKSAVQTLAIIILIMVGVVSIIPICRNLSEYWSEVLKTF